MTKMRITAALATTAVAALGLGLAAPAAQAAPAAERPGTTSLAEVLAADGQRFDRKWADFDVVEKVAYTILGAKPDSPVAVLADGSTRITAFVPTDRAFRQLAKALTGKAPKTEKATFRTLAGLVDVDTLEAVLLYHVVPGATLGSGKVLKSDGAELTTAQGGTVTVSVDDKSVSLGDLDPDARDPRANAKQLDLNKGNRQIAHGIDRVLRPVDL
jgi:uncharacterized surface protein with fasciclin (FAS1) repeats